MISADQIRQVISDYLSDKDSDKFILAFSRLSFNVRKLGDVEAISLADKVQFKLASAYSRHIPRDVLMKELAILAEQPVLRCSVMINGNYWISPPLANYGVINQTVVAGAAGDPSLASSTLFGTLPATVHA